jgi:MFS family permease
LLIASFITAVPLVVFSFSSNLYLSLAMSIFIGLGSSGQMALGNSLVQYYTDATYRGRVMSFFMLGFGFSSLGAFFAGLLAEGIGAPWSVGLLAIVLLIVTLVTMVMPQVRKLD